MQNYITKLTLRVANFGRVTNLTKILGTNAQLVKHPQKKHIEQYYYR